MLADYKREGVSSEQRALILENYITLLFTVLISTQLGPQLRRQGVDQLVDAISSDPQAFKLYAAPPTNNMTEQEKTLIQNLIK